MQNYYNQCIRAWEGSKRLSHHSNRTAIGLYIEFFYCFMRYGCLPRQFFQGGFWNKRANDRKDILTYRRFVKVMNTLNQAHDVHILENKAHFNRFFADYVHREWLLSSESTPADIASFIQRHGRVIIKPYDEMEGHGIYSIDASKINDIDAEAAKLAKQQVMVEQILIQHPDMVFGNTSVNTIRVHTILDRQGKGHILSCILRAGVGDTVVDNYCSGGAIYPVDVEQGIVIGKGKSHTGDSHLIHPQTDTVMLGYRIPNWAILREETVRAAERLPSLRIIGWDVAITKDGIALIEGNHNPDYELFEFIGEGKAYPAIKQFM